MIIRDGKQLTELMDLVHDHWFNLETVALDPKSRSVVLYVEPRRSALAQGSCRGITLTVKNVEDLTVKDTEHVRDYDINEITFDPTTRTIVLTGGIPIEIVLRVSALEIDASSRADPTAAQHPS